MSLLIVKLIFPFWIAGSGTNVFSLSKLSSPGCIVYGIVDESLYSILIIYAGMDITIKLFKS